MRRSKTLAKVKGDIDECAIDWALLVVQCSRYQERTHKRANTEAVVIGIETIWCSLIVTIALIDSATNN